MQDPIHGVRAKHGEERVAVSRGARNRFSGDHPARARAVFGNHRLAEPLGQFGRDHPGDGIRGAACGGGDDDAYRFLGPGRLRRREEGQRTERHGDDFFHVLLTVS